ncbi:hypothetical protein OKW21_004970 [Catalinimonas alkaloidigena]|nr:hypothetical protein [Catalinimonas alkaloidigena]
MHSSTDNFDNIMRNSLGTLLGCWDMCSGAGVAAS